jgi:hypothetical protein
LKRDKWEGRCNRLEPGNYWWCPIPGKLDSLGSIYLKLFVDGEYTPAVGATLLTPKLTVFENVTCAATLIEDAYDASDSMRSTIIVPAIFYPNVLSI